MEISDTLKAVLMISIIGIAAFFAISFVVFPGFIESIGAFVTGQQSNCNDAPFNPNCFCDEGFNKQPTSTPLKVYCESNDLMFDPLSPGFQIETLAYAKAYLRENFPECDSIQCPAPATLISNADVALTPEHRAVYFECRNNFGVDLWEMMFSLETGSVERVFCQNILEPPIPADNPGKLLSDLEWNRINLAYYQNRLKFTADCINDSGKATTTVNLPIGFTAESWIILENGFSVGFFDGRWRITQGGVPVNSTQATLCRITSSDSTSAKIECNLVCPAQGISNWSTTVFAYYPTSFMEANYCKLNDNFYSTGQKVCCETRNYIQCQSDNSWNVVNTCRASSYKDCGEVGH